MKRVFSFFATLLLAFMLIGCAYKEEVELDFNITINNNFLMWDEIKDAKYELLINNEFVQTTTPYFKIEELPVTVQIRVRTSEYYSIYTKPVTIDQSSNNVANLLFNYYNEEVSMLPSIKLDENANYYLFDNNYKQIDSINYIIDNNHLVLNKDFVNNIDEDLYLLTDTKLYKIDINIINEYKPYVVNPYIYSDLTSDVVVLLNNKDANVSISETNLPSNTYQIVNNKLIIDYNYINELFENNERNSFIFGITFKLDNTYFLSTIHIYKH